MVSNRPRVASRAFSPNHLSASKVHSGRTYPMTRVKCCRKRLRRLGLSLSTNMAEVPVFGSASQGLLGANKPRTAKRARPLVASWMTRFVERADTVEHGAEDLLEMFGAFVEVLRVSDVKDAIRLRHRQAFDQAGVRRFDGGERQSGASARRAIRGR
jgi:hypothetical protein